MRKILKMLQENFLIFLDFIFVLVAMIASLFVPYLVYGIYVGYLFTLMDVHLLVEEKKLAKIQIMTLLLGVVCTFMGQRMNSAFCLYGLQGACLVFWLVQFILYLRYMEKMKK